MISAVRRALLPLAFAVLVAAAAGCGDSSKGNESKKSTTTAPPHAFSLISEWHGRLTQKKLQPFDVNATIRSLSSGTRNTVHYSGIDCSGNWTYLGRTNRAFRFREVIDRGKSSTCKGVGTVSLIPKGTNQLRYEFRGGGVVSSGVLSRG
jgi:hypothetical protein